MRKLLSVFLLLVLHCLASVDSSSVQLASYNVDKSEITVSGLSSGGFFAVQMHIAYSSIVKGAGVIAGGPYYCAEGSMGTALTTCMSSPFLLNVNRLISTTDSWGKSNYIDPVENLSGSPVYIFHGTKDSTVVEGVVNALQTYYLNYNVDLTYRKDVKAGHAFITDNKGGTCGSTTSPYINNCGEDITGDVLKKLYGSNLLARTQKLGGSFVEFDQSEFFEAKKAFGLANSGWIYIPINCQNGGKCKLHVVFHGCVQNYESVGDVVVKDTGYNEWADVNDIIVVYPQTGRGSTNNCWDWWGDQNDKSNYAKKSGNQMAIVKRIIDRVAGGTNDGNNPNSSSSTEATPTKSTAATHLGACYSTNNYKHVTEGRAYQKLGLVYAKGSDDYMGLYNTFAYTKLRMTGTNYYIIDSSC